MHEKTTLVRFLKRCKKHLFSPEDELPRGCFPLEKEVLDTANATRNQQGQIIIFDNLREPLEERPSKLEKGQKVRTEAEFREAFAEAGLYIKAGPELNNPN